MIATESALLEAREEEARYFTMFETQTVVYFSSGLHWRLYQNGRDERPPRHIWFKQSLAYNGYITRHTAILLLQQFVIRNTIREQENKGVNSQA